MEDVKKLALDILINSMEYNGEETQIIEELENVNIDDILNFINKE